MAEQITVGPIYIEDVSVGYGSVSDVLVIDGSSQTMHKVNFSQLNQPYAVAYSASPDFDIQLGQVQTIILHGNVTSSTIINGGETMPAGARIVLRIAQDDTGSHTFTYPTTVSGASAFPISSVPLSTTRVELEWTGYNWDFASVPLVVTSGALLGNILSGAGTPNVIPKFASPNTLTNSGLSDNGSGILQFQYDSASVDARLWVFNSQNLSGSRSVLCVGGNLPISDNVDISLLVQRSGNTSNGWNQTGVVRTGTGATAGMAISTGAGPIEFQPGGITTVGGFWLSTTPSSSFHNFQIGTIAAGATDSQPLFVRRDQNGSTDVYILNATASVSARATVRVQATTGDAYFGVTSPSYSPAGGVGPSTAFIYTGGSTAGGLILQTTTGNVSLQVAGTSTVATITRREMQMVGRLRAMSATRVSPQSGASCDVFYDGIAGGVIAAANWGSSESSSEMHIMHYAGNSHLFYTGDNYATIAQKVTIINGMFIGSAEDPGNGSLNVEVDIFKGMSAFTNPDYVFEYWATGLVTRFKENPGARNYRGLLDLADVEAYARRHLELPGVATAAGVFNRTDVLLEKLEEAYIYIFAINKRLIALEGGTQTVYGSV